MSASVGNKHVVKEAEFQEMSKTEAWDVFLVCIQTMAECNPAGGPVEVLIANEDGTATGLRLKAAA